MAGESFINRINPTYCSCLITYVDVLGFAELIEKSRKDPTLVPKIASLLSAIKVAASSGGQIHRDADGKAIDIFSAFNFSDLTIRTTQIPTGNQVSKIVQWEIFYLAELQLNLLIDGYPIRGSMCVGDLYARESEGIVFGPSLVKAHVLESSYAIFPRIVIDRDLAATIKREGVIPTWRDYINRGEDGVHYLDYLFGSSVTAFETGVPGTADPRRIIRAHRDFIKEVIEDDIDRKSERTKQKYIWLAQYHNNVIKRLLDRLKDKAAGIDEFGIPESLLEF